MLFAFEPILARPAFTDLLEQDIPLGVVSMASWWVRSEITEGIVRRGPSFKMPGPWLPVRPADCRAVLFNEHTDRRVAVHGLEHIQAGAVQSDERQVVIERRKPPFVEVRVIRDEVGHVPGQEA